MHPNTTVFGSNLNGIHGAGAAYAAHKAGFPWGLGAGYDKCGWYALPTRIVDIDSGRYHTLPLNVIQQYVNQFRAFAEMQLDYEHRGAAFHMSFKVTCVGTGHAGHLHKDIAPMFKGMPGNCFFDTLWEEWLGAGPNMHYWGTF